MSAYASGRPPVRIHAVSICTSKQVFSTSKASAFVLERSDLELASYVGIRWHTSAYVGIRRHTSVRSDLELAALVVEAAVVVKAVRHLVAQDAADAAVVARV
jgi:hypothetical protein